ncbi:hypothetical protein PR048_006567 [Dryococelus australis]|uniref:Uncharacterized protein n=1 Tax=Dryococelus australis TaxID=614101 RepID=A0ABQ9IBD9_9NEOP|nr:hypothetical protein PR048_006567 [Dryococelus australis]
MSGVSGSILAFRSYVALDIWLVRHLGCVTVGISGWVVRVVDTRFTPPSAAVCVVEDTEQHTFLTSFVTALRHLSYNCGFDALHDDLIKDCIVCGVWDKRIKDRLLREPNRCRLIWLGMGCACDVPPYIHTLTIVPGSHLNSLLPTTPHHLVMGCPSNTGPRVRRPLVRNSSKCNVTSSVTRPGNLTIPVLRREEDGIYTTTKTILSGRRSLRKLKKTETTVSGAKKKYDDVKIAILLHVLGEDAQDLYSTLESTSRRGESIDSFVTALRRLSYNCGFDALHDDLIKDCIVCGVWDKRIKDRLLREPNLTLANAVQICKQLLKTIDNDGAVYAVQELHSRSNITYKETTPGNAAGSST